VNQPNPNAKYYKYQNVPPKPTKPKIIKDPYQHRTVYREGTLADLNHPTGRRTKATGIKGGH